MFHRRSWLRALPISAERTSHRRKRTLALEECESRILYRLASDVEAQAAASVALAAWRALGCRDAGRVDLRSDAAGRPQFMEVNPLAGLHPTHSDLPILAAQAGIPYEKLIGRILRQGLQRAGLSRRPQPQIVAAE